MKNEIVGCLVFPRPRGISYLCGFDSFDYGALLLPYFSEIPGNAYPLTDKQADFVLARIDFDIRKRLKFAPFPKADLAPDLFSLANSPITLPEVST